MPSIFEPPKSIPIRTRTVVAGIRNQVSGIGDGKGGRNQESGIGIQGWARRKESGARNRDSGMGKDGGFSSLGFRAVRRTAIFKSDRDVRNSVRCGPVAS